ncbi:Aste57867_13682 [Aphanomyces stellatus]|uniref:Aste57867_13682 protein n=1 Tax=Aphanomyces stellatus TaxID=120398 RepID=A0A485KZ08_9STRA|nr:hypothetical protein As57867_013632 [Aphanomyces stellatus]VFT90515.1 Aste57867_13682 [Aphanomyces stellatus]
MAQQGFPRGPPSSYSGPPGGFAQPPRGPYGPSSTGGGFAPPQQQQPPHSASGGFPPQQQQVPQQPPRSSSGAFPPQQHFPPQQQPPRSSGGGFPPQQLPNGGAFQQPPRSMGGFPQGGPPLQGHPQPGFPPQQGPSSQPGFPQQGAPMGFQGPPRGAPPNPSAFGTQVDDSDSFSCAPGPPGMQNMRPAPGPPMMQGPPQQGQHIPPPQMHQPGAFHQGPPPPQMHQPPPGAFHQGPPPPQGYGAPQGQQLPPPHMMGNPNEPVFTPGPPFHQSTAAPIPKPTPAAPAPPAQRIDPTQIPRPLGKDDIVTYVAKGATLTMPPPANSKYICIDDGCASPRFVRPSLNHVPESKDLLNQSALPLGAILCPLAKLQPGELPIPLVDFGPSGPLRCTRCKAYVNCFTKFIQGGRLFACNICAMHNETPREYYCAVDPMGKRRDATERMELARGSVEFLVPPVYSVRPAQEVIVVFCLDVSLFAFQSHLVASIVAALPAVLETLRATSPAAKFGLVTFDTAVHYYRLDQDAISMCVCPDVDDPAAPLPANAWLLPVNSPDAMDKIHELQDLIVTLFGASAKNQAVSGAAVTSVVDSLQLSGGRICLFHAGPPRLGVGKITREEAASVYGTTKEVELFAGGVSKNAHYEELARLSAKSFISVDVCSVANPYSDLAEVSRLAELTGGYVLHLPQFDKDKPEHMQYCTRFLTHWFGKDKGMEAVLKIRVSAGLRVDTIWGSFMPSGASDDEVNIALLDQDTAVGVTFVHDGRLTDEHMSIQAALLYTRVDGVRCVRVHNLALPVANLVTNVFRHADLDATCALWQRMSVKLIRDKSIMSGNGQAVKEKLVDDCVQVLTNYRKHCATNSSSGQLILPESLKLLPLYTLASLKSRALRNNLTGQQARGIIDVRADERVMLLHILNTVPVEHAVSAVYPKMYALHDLTEEVGTLNEKGQMILPAPLPPTAEKLEENGLFLLHSSTFLYLFIGAKTNPTLLEEVFGVSHVDTSEQSINLVGPAEQAGVLREQIQAVVSHLQMQSPVPVPLEIMTKSDWRSVRFLSSLVEDRTRNEVSYVEFLCQVHKKIQYKMM